ncbi:hypothetical protein ACFYWY_37275 [Streptomyces sp. NPDC002870]|uniref:hypothetical protein n=1 Tax=Streptomyces sp. NPDC002870 TaxID=3364666 RepID=UPI0036739BF3
MTSPTSASSASAQPPNSGEGGRRTQTCAECGARPAPGQSFCDDCGAVLSWTPDRTPNRTPDRTASQGTAQDDASEEGREPAPAPDPAAASAPDHRSDPESARVDDSARTDPPSVTRPDSAPAVSPTEETLPIDPVPAAVAPASASPDPGSSADERARALLVPVTDPNQPVTPAPSVAPVLPGRPAAARPRVHAPTVEPDEEGGPPARGAPPATGPAATSAVAAPCPSPPARTIRRPGVCLGGVA